ncbi:MAG: hypothetical protein PHU85_11860 [Phycisphaerae bacterium]|nr:hypothetical protein [Phycisphaerae bacterium]
MPTATYAINVSLGGVTIDKRISRTGSHPNPYEETVPAANVEAVVAWTGTDADSASASLAAGHGLTDGTFDVFWTSGGANYCRYGAAGTFTDDNLALEGGAGDEFPATATSGVIVSKQTSVNANIDGDAASLIAVSLEFTDAASAAVGSISCKDTSGTVIAQIDLVANQPIVTDIDGGATNIYTGNPITTFAVSHNDATNNATIKVLSMEDATT